MNASDLPFDRSGISRDLHLDLGAGAASLRCDVNSQLGEFDLASCLVERLGLSLGKAVYDCGCGSGRHLELFAQTVQPGGKAVGFDSSPEAVKLAAERGLDARLADLAEIPMPTGSADSLCCSYSVYYHPDLRAVVREWARLLAPGGVVAVAGPALGGNEELYEFHRRVTGQGPSDSDLMALGYVEGATAGALRESDFDQVEVEAFVNRVRFPSREKFITYWKSTSLYLRTVPGELAIPAQAAEDLPEEPIVTKRVSVAVALRR